MNWIKAMTDMLSGTLGYMGPAAQSGVNTYMTLKENEAKKEQRQAEIDARLAETIRANKAREEDRALLTALAGKKETTQEEQYNKTREWQKQQEANTTEMEEKKFRFALEKEKDVVRANRLKREDELSKIAGASAARIPGQLDFATTEGAQALRAQAEEDAKTLREYRAANRKEGIGVVNIELSPNGQKAYQNLVTRQGAGEKLAVGSIEQTLKSLVEEGKVTQNDLDIILFLIKEDKEKDPQSYKE